MQDLPKDLQRKLALELSAPDLINFCLLNKTINKNVCESQDFWRQKLSIDYPKLFFYYQKNKIVLINPKNTYIRKFTEVSRKIEEVSKKLYKNVDKDITYDKIYNEIYVIYEKVLKKQDISYEKIMLLIYNVFSTYLTETDLHLINKLIIDLINKDKLYDYK